MRCRRSRASPAISTLRLCACRFHDGIGAKSSSIFDFDWSVHWPNLTTLDVAGTCTFTDRDVMTLSVRLPRLTALNVTGGTLTSHAPLALLVEHRRSTLRELCIDDLGTTDRPLGPARAFAEPRGRPRRLRRPRGAARPRRSGAVWNPAVPHA